MRNLEEVVDAYTRSSKLEPLPAEVSTAIMAYALVGANNEVSFDGRDLPGTLARLLASTPQMPVLVNGVRLSKAGGFQLFFPPTTSTPAARGVALLNAWAQVGAGDTIELDGISVYQISSFLECKPGITFDGHGATIQAAAMGTGSWGISGSHSGSLIWGVSGAPTPRCHITNIIFDCNMANQTATDACIGGAFIYGGGFSTISNCRAINWGTKNNVECFAIVIAGYDFGIPSIGNKILNCQVDTPAQIHHGSGGTTAISIFGVGSGATPAQGWQIGAEIAGCCVGGVVTQGGINAGTVLGRPQNFNAYGIGFGSGGSVRHNFAYDITCPDGSAFANSYYHDTGTCRDLSITDNFFINCRSGVQISPAINASSIVTGVEIARNYIIPANGGVGIVLDPVFASGGNNTHASKNVIKDNFVPSGYGAGYGIYLNNCTQNTIADNIIEGSAGPIFENTGVGINIFSGNRTTAGVMVKGDGLKSRVTTQFNKVSDTVLANIPGLVVNVASGKAYTFRAVVYVLMSGDSPGKLSVFGTATLTSFIGTWIVPNIDDNSLQTEFVQGAFIEDDTEMDFPNNDGQFAIFEGTIVVNAGGTLAIRGATQGDGQLHVLVGSTLMVQEIP